MHSEACPFHVAVTPLLVSHSLMVLASIQPHAAWSSNLSSPILLQSITMLGRGAATGSRTHHRKSHEHPTCASHVLRVRPSQRVARRHAAQQCAATAAAGYSYPPFMPPIIREVEDPDCHRTASQMRRVPVNVASLSSEGPLNTAVVGPTGAALEQLGCGPNDPVVVLLHSFDSSSLEWRKLQPRLEATNRLPVVSVDLVGWGFTDTAAWRRNPNLPVNPALKREHLEAFRQQHLGGRPIILAGSSLGGTIATDYALTYPQAVKGLALIDAQWFAKPVSPAPRPLAVLGVSVLRMIWLRKMANQMAYHNKDKFVTANDDVWKAGRLHTFLPGWLEANVAFLQSGGYDMTAGRLKQLTAPMLLLWGKQDEIISPDVANKWQATLGPKQCKLVWVDACGHSPHIEQPDFTCSQILQFLDGILPAAATSSADADIRLEVVSVQEDLQPELVTTSVAA